MLKPADIMGRVGLKPTAEEQRRRVALPEGRTSGCKRSKPLATLQPQPAHLIPATEGRTYADFLAEARARQAGAGFAGPLLSVTDEELARADADISWRLERARRRLPDPYFTRRF